MVLGPWPVLAEVVLDASVERLDLPRHGGGAFLWGDIWSQWLGETKMEMETETETETEMEVARTGTSTSRARKTHLRKLQRE